MIHIMSLDPSILVDSPPIMGIGRVVGPLHPNTVNPKHRMTRIVKNPALLGDPSNPVPIRRLILPRWLRAGPAVDQRLAHGAVGQRVALGAVLQLRLQRERSDRTHLAVSNHPLGQHAQKVPPRLRVEAKPPHRTKSKYFHCILSLSLVYSLTLGPVLDVVIMATCHSPPISKLQRRLPSLIPRVQGQNLLRASGNRANMASLAQTPLAALLSQ